MEPTPSASNSVAIPVAIVAGFAMIALAIFFTSNRSSGPADATPQQLATDSAVTATTGVAPVTEDDYILGNPNAPILMVEYSDYDCPFCKQFHTTLHQIMDEYGVTGRVAWVYRQFPIGQLHPNAPRISKAALCVGDIGGNTAFWNFTDLVFDERDIDEQTNITKLPQYAEAVGVDVAAYNTCMADDAMEQEVLDDVQAGLNLGITGTPHTVLIVGNDQATLTGAESYETLKGIIENLIDQLDGNFDTETQESAS